MLAFSEGGGRVSDTAVLQVSAGVTIESLYQICYFPLADFCESLMSYLPSRSLLLFSSLILCTALRLCHCT